MNDIESEVFTTVAKAARAAFPDLFFTDEIPLNIPKKLPCAALAETSNTAPKSMIDSSGEEKFSDVLYQVTIYTNRQANKKSDCRAILKVIDSILHGLGFRRESCTPQVPMNSNSIYWLSARYTARVKGKTIYRL